MRRLVFKSFRLKMPQEFLEALKNFSHRCSTWKILKVGPRFGVNPIVELC